MRTILLCLVQNITFQRSCLVFEQLQESHDVFKGCSHSVWHTQLYGRDGACHSCTILARIFWVLAWDLKISRYLGIVLRLSLNFIILGIGIEIEIEFWILQYWYWYWYLVLMFLLLILRLRLKFLSPVSIIGIVSFHKLIKLCNQAVNS